MYTRLGWPRFAEPARTRPYFASSSNASFFADFAATAPKLNVYFDNVGGEILDLALTQVNRGVRVVLCGASPAFWQGRERY